MSGHTPGPWRATDRGKESSGWDIEAGTYLANSIWLACAHNDHGEPGGFPTNEQAEANARLIVASPELLQCCKESLSWHLDSVSPGARAIWEPKLIARLKDLIAKAEPQEVKS